MMTQAFYTGISGLKAQQTAIDVVSDNLANTSTIGYRGYSSEFSNMFEEMIVTQSGSSTVNSSIGVGSKLNSVVMDEHQGVIQLTGLTTDLAIMGDGWFGIQGDKDPLYTRDGSFTFDSERSLVTNDGYYVLGTMGTNINEGVLTGQLAETPLGDVSAQEKLRFPDTLLVSVEPTTTASFTGNLGTEDAVRTISAGVLDSQGNRNNLRLEFSQTIPQPATGTGWDVTATVESLDGLTTYSSQSATMLFTEMGDLQSTTLSSIDNNGTSVGIDFGTGFDGLLSNANPFSSSSSADGLESGELLGYDINKNGQVLATFTNGVQSSVGQVAVFHFQNDRGLERVNGARFTESKNSGNAIFFKDADGNNIIGTDITNKNLEGSNVRMEAGLTDLIVLQRAFDANSKSITTADQMLQKALDMGA